MVIVPLLLIATFAFFTESHTESETTFQLILTLIFLVVISMFGSLTTNVDKEFIKISFGIGLIYKKFLIREIQSCKAVRNPWWYGFGIRLTPNGWLYSVSGFDAVELQLKNNKKVRIGTDKPKELIQAINRAKQI